MISPRILRLWPLVLALLLGVPQAARAEHFSGVSITYSCVGANFYEITLDLFVDCSGSALLAQSLDLTNDCGVSFTVNNLPLVFTEEVSQLCNASVANSTCNGGSLFGMQHYQFTTTVFLSPCNNWTISWDTCCRSGMNNLLGNPGTYAEATLNNASGICDQSPAIADNTIPSVCVNDPVLYNPGITDPDGNTMVFSLVNAQFGAPAPTDVNYQPGFTGATAFPGITIDPATGQLSFTPTLTGNYVVVIEVTTYDSNGIPIGTIMRDFMVVVINCASTPPITDGLTNVSNGLIVSAGGVEVCDGIPFCVDLPFTDSDVGGAVTLVSNAAALLPGATFTVSGTNPAVGTLCWTPDPAFSPANIFVTATDNACPIPNVASATILITVVQPPPIPPDAGTNGSVSTCPGGAPIALFPLLGGTPDLGGVWTDPDGVAHNGIFSNPGDPFGTYTYTAGNGCLTDQAIVTVTANGGVDPGTDGALNTCSTSPAVALIASLGGSPQAGGTWTGPSPVVGGNYNPATMAPGAYTYTLNGVPPCPAVSSTVTVTESSGPNAGTNGTLTLCATSATTSLFAQLGGTPQAGGTWSGPSAVVGGNYDPATMAPGIYTYTITGTAPCANATATVTVTENAVANAGTNGTLTICGNGAATSLFAQLGGTPQAGGTWSGPSAVVGGNYDPSTMAPGVYTYTVTGTAPCANATATVTVTENATANAGTNGTLTICGNGAAASLFAQLGGTPQAGGTWSGPSAVVGGNYDPATMAPGVYTYTVTGTAPCANATASVTVTENAVANAGTNGTLTICGNGAATSLFAQLGGTPQAGGTWSGPSAVGGGNYDPSTMAPGVYTYTVTGTAPCASATATVTVTENAVANAGTNGTLTSCGDGAAVSLFAQLGGTPQVGGTWSGPSPLVSGNYDPATMLPGAYIYTVTGTAPCANATATVTVTENAVANAGIDGTLIVCADGAATSLFAQLDGTPQVGGTWSGPSPVVGGNYDPATMLPGAYIYTVTGTAPCANVTATVTVTENAVANAGTDGTLTICGNGTATSLFAQLGGTPQVGGTWSGPSPVVGGNYDPATMLPGAYVYTVTGTTPCANATATVTVTENAVANAGVDGTLIVCADGAATSLFAQLGGSPQVGGTWSGPSPVVGGNYDPATMAPGVYTYTVTGTAPCANATATVTVTENSVANAGANGTLTICGNDAAVSLFAQLGGTPQVGGAWSGSSAVVSGNYDPATMVPGVYTYTVTGTAPCANATATVTVTENALANAGSNGTLTICGNGAAASLLAQLGGTPQVGGAWSGPSAVVGGNYDPATMLPGAYVYTVTGTAPCANATATVTVTENAVANAGVDGTFIVCADGAATSLFTELGGTPQVGGTWSGPSPVISGNYDPATMLPGAYVYTVTGTAPCANATATVTVTENAVANAGVDGTFIVCADGAATSLFTELGGTPQVGGTWSGPSPVISGNYDPVTMLPGAYIYTVTGTAPCANATATVTVTENAVANAGVDGTLIVCADGTTTSLFTQLGGTPQAGGTWTGPSPVVGGNYDPATMAPGAYTYTVIGMAPCTDASATVTVNETSSPNAGGNSALTVCGNGAVIDLFAQLGGTPDAGGTWSGPSAVVGGSYDPASMDAGVYTYTITAVAPCISDAATVTITENAPTNAGTSGTLTLCNTGAAVALINSLGGTPQAGGTWSGPSPVISANYDPATMTPGVYSYTVLGVAPCTNATATVTVNETSSPDAGGDATLTVCGNGAVIDLFAQLGGTPDAGGTWSGPSAVVGGSYDPASMDAGVYTYTITAVAPCISDAATVTITENAPTNAGANGTLTLCNTGAAVALINSLGGTPQAGGTWSGPSPVVGGNYDPATMAPGAYTYTVIGMAPCTDASATVTVNETSSPNAGGNSALTVCGNGAVIDLFAQLGGTPDAGGTWSGPSAVVGGNYDPATMDAGVYTYTITAVAPCISDAATVTITENAPTNAGTSGTLTLCNTGAAVALINSLGGTPQAGGTWSGPSPVIGGNYDPATMTPGVYSYTVLGVAPCTNATATVTVNETSSPDAGGDATLTVCGNGAVIDLFAQLGGTPDAGGTWSGPSAVVGGNYDPATMDAGVYTYTITAVAPCISDAATVTITENAPTNAGTSGTLTLCNTGAAVALINSLGGTPQAGGTWSGPSPVIGGNYDPATMTPGVYSYTVLGVAPCTNATATVTVNETSSPDAGGDAALTVCGNGAVIDLFAQLGGTPDAGGTWSGPSAVVGGNYDPATMDAGVYTYTITAVAPCISDAATVSITENAPTNAGTSGTLTLCNTGAAVALINSLGGTPQAGGTWSGPSPVIGGNYDPATMTPGVYSYTVLGVAPCTNATATVTVNETSSPDAGGDATLTVCGNGAVIDLFAQLGGTPDAGGTWSGPSAVVGGNYDPATMDAGVYTYTLTAVAPCISDAATVTITEEEPPNAGTGSILNLCEGAATVDLFTLLGNAPMPGGTWFGPTGVFDGTLDPSEGASGIFTYSITGTACPNSVAVFTINIVDGPDAGEGTTLTLCSNASAFNLLGQLGGSPEPGGTWTGPDGSGVGPVLEPATSVNGIYTYTLPGNADCPADVAQLSITINTAPQAGTNGSLALCETSPTTSLFDGLGGTLDAGGVWTGPDGLPHSTVVDPASDLSGNYTYTVAGIAPCVSAAAQVSVFIAPLPNAGENATATFCTTNAPVGLVTLLNGAPEANGLWTGPAGTTVGATFAPTTSEPGLYTYTVPGIAPCGNDIAELFIAVSIAPDAGSDGSITLCENESAVVTLFDLLGGSPDAGGSWTAPDGTAFSGLFEPGLDDEGPYTYTLDATAPCAAETAVVLIDIVSVPVADIQVEGNFGCTPTLITLTNSAAGGSCTWTLWNGETVEDCAPVVRSIGTAGTYDVTLVIDAGNGCGADTLTMEDLITVYQQPAADFFHLPEGINTLDPFVQFNNTSSGALAYVWDIAGLATSTESNTNYTFPAQLPAEYTVCLTAVASANCTDVICRTIEIEDGPTVLVPNAFTPDADGINDLFKPAVLGIDPDAYRFDVFDRWGQPLFSTDDPNASWDGRSPNGTEVQIGVYVWKLVAKDLYSSARFEHVGHVSVVR